LETRVQFKFDRFSGFLSDFSANVSPGGMFIRTRTPQPVGTVLELEFRLGDGFELIRGRGEVVWTRAEDEGPGRPAGMGLRFLELSQGSKELIYRIVDHHIQQGGTPFDVTQSPPDPIPPPPQPASAPPTTLSPLRFDLSPSPAPPAPPSPKPLAPPLSSPAADAKAWLPSLEEEPGGFDPSPYAPPLTTQPDDWMKARQALPREPLSEPEAGAAHDHPAAGPLFGASLEPEPPRRSRRALPWVLIGVLVALAAGAYLFRDTLLGLAGLGGDEGSENIAQATPPTVRPRPGRLRSRALPSASPAPGAAATPVDTPVPAPTTEVSPVRPAVTPAKAPAPAPTLPPAPTPAPVAKMAKAAAATPPVVPVPTPAPTPKAGARPQGEKPAPLPAVREDTGPAATGVDRITFEKSFGGTDIILWGNGAIRSRTYVRSRIEGNPPRELIRISGIKRPAPAARLAVGTPEVLQVRTGLHTGDELHVVLDLAGPKVTVTGVEEGENRLRIHLQKQ
ncbi:MAG TPA: TIGR02266 family protein, partial [Thermoanaerobaculia bacterium]|nr:TIGR02266 family protein [Thermoanaerobaculia bacterium]